MRPADFIHPEDAAALRQMESIPGFAAFIKKILAIGLEPLQYGINTASFRSVIYTVKLVIYLLSTRHIFRF